MEDVVAVIYKETFMIYDNNDGPIYSVMTSKSPCGSYGGVELDGSSFNGVVLNAANCTSGKIGPYCRGGVVSSGGTSWCCFGPCASNSDCLNGGSCNSGSCCGVNLYSCPTDSCYTPALGNLCDLKLLNGCPYDNLCGLTAAEIGSTFTGQNEIGGQPAALVCCSDLGFSWSFSQGLLDEETWNEFWCQKYSSFNTAPDCGNLPVNDYNRCQYLMFRYGPTEAGDYCDRIDLYLLNTYSSANVATYCSS
jgi:hypothetical protein